MQNLNIKVLLIAYACEPYKGSEPGIGFNWSLALSEYFDITVLTRKNNKKVIEEYLSRNKIFNIKFIYFDIPILSKIKNYVPFGVNIYALLWEYFCSTKIKKNNYKVIHRLTFVNVITLNKFYKYCNIYINGFLAGGEQSPKSIYDNYSLKFKFIEYLRYKIYVCFLKSPLARKIYDKSKLLITVTSETKSFILNYYKCNHIEVIPAIFNNNFIEQNDLKLDGDINIVYAGRLIYWKNVDIIIRAIKLIKLSGYRLKLNIIGGGPEKNKLKILSKKLDVSDIVCFKNEMNQEMLFQELKKNSLLVFASSHDSGGMIIIEAIELNVPVLFLDTGGPKQIFDGIDYPLKVNPNQSFENIIKEFSDKMIWFINNYEQFMFYYKEVREKILNRYNLKEKVKTMVNLYNRYIYESSDNS